MLIKILLTLTTLFMMVGDEVEQSDEGSEEEENGDEEE